MGNVPKLPKLRFLRGKKGQRSVVACSKSTRKRMYNIMHLYRYTLDGDRSPPPTETKVPRVIVGCQQKESWSKKGGCLMLTIPRSPKLSGVIQLLKGSLGPIRKPHFTSTKTFRPYLWLSDMNEGISHLAAYGHPSH